MPNYLANRFFNSLSEMSAFAVDSTDEDGLGPFIVPINSSDFMIVVWRRYSDKVIDNINTFAANGIGRWIALGSSGTSSISWNSSDFSQWNSSDFSQWNSASF